MIQGQSSAKRHIRGRSCRGLGSGREGQRTYVALRDGKFVDSPLEGAGFEPSVPWQLGAGEIRRGSRSGACRRRREREDPLGVRSGTSTGRTARPSARSKRSDSRAASGRLLEAAQSSKHDPGGTEAGGLERSLSVTGNFGAGSGSGALMKGSRFAGDSMLEETGFEPSVPRQICSRFESSPPPMTV